MSARHELGSLVQILGTDRVYDPGCHCAFTDLAHWRGRVWLAFREAVNHSIHPSSQIVVLASADHGKTFQLQARIASRGLDVRDPHFYVQDDQLHIMIPCWRLGVEPRRRVTILARSDDGQQWETFRDLAIFEDVTVWRPRRSNVTGDGALYAAGYGRSANREIGAVRLYRSEDGLAWQQVSIIHDEQLPNETELCFLPDGELLALVRREEEPFHPLLARAKPPYKGPWKKTECDRYLQGPLLEHLGDGKFLVVGRSPKAADENLKKPEWDQEKKAVTGEPRVTRIFSLDPETGKLIPGVALESGNDTSYAAFLRLPADAQKGRAGAANALISYYSGHGYENGLFRSGDESQRAAIFVSRVVV